MPNSIYPSFQHASLNKTQMDIIEATLNLYFDSIVENQSPENAIKSLQATFIRDVPKNRISESEKLEILESIEVVRKILFHPSPQNRSEHYPYFGRPDNQNLIVYKDANGNPAFEQKGLLGLTARNDNTALPVTRGAVVEYVFHLLAIAIRNQLLLLVEEPSSKHVTNLSEFTNFFASILDSDFNLKTNILSRDNLQKIVFGYFQEDILITFPQLAQNLFYKGPEFLAKLHFYALIGICKATVKDHPEITLSIITNPESRSKFLGSLLEDVIYPNVALFLFEKGNDYLLNNFNMTLLGKIYIKACEAKPSLAPTITRFLGSERVSEIIYGRFRSDVIYQVAKIWNSKSQHTTERDLDRLRMMRPSFFSSNSPQIPVELQKAIYHNRMLAAYLDKGHITLKDLITYYNEKPWFIVALCCSNIYQGIFDQTITVEELSRLTKDQIGYIVNQKFEGLDLKSMVETYNERSRHQIS